MNLWQERRFVFGLSLIPQCDLGWGLIITRVLMSVWTWLNPGWIYAEVTLFQWVLINSIALMYSVLPDIDSLTQMRFPDNPKFAHRLFLHRPILVVGGVFAIHCGVEALSSFIFQKPFSFFFPVLASACLLVHFVHDSLAGCGIPWTGLFGSKPSFFQIWDKVHGWFKTWEFEEVWAKRGTALGTSGFRQAVEDEFLGLYLKPIMYASVFCAGILAVFPNIYGALGAAFFGGFVLLCLMLVDYRQLFGGGYE